MKRTLLSLLCVPLLLALAFVAARPAYAANCDDDQRVMGDNFTLAKGQQLDSNLVVMGGYSHTRLRERLLGGVTYDLMHESPVPLLMAH